MARVIGIFSSKGGVGKTTLSINLAASVARDFSKQVCLMDTNLSCASLGVQLGLHLTPTNLNMVLRGEANVDDVLMKHPSGMSVLPASIQLKESFTQQSSLPSIVNNLRGDYEYVFLDTAPSVGNETQWAMHAADEAVIVTDSTMPSLIEAIKISKLAEKYRVKILGVVVNKSTSEGLGLDEISYFTRLPLLGQVPMDTRVDRSLKHNMPAVHYLPHSKVSQQVKKISSKIVGEDYEVPLTQKLLNLIGIN